MKIIFKAMCNTWHARLIAGKQTRTQTWNNFTHSTTVTALHLCTSEHILLPNRKNILYSILLPRENLALEWMHSNRNQTNSHILHWSATAMLRKWLLVDLKSKIKSLLSFLHAFLYRIKMEIVSSIHSDWKH